MPAHTVHGSTGRLRTTFCGNCMTSPSGALQRERWSCAFHVCSLAEGEGETRPALSPGNVEKTMTSPVTVIIAYDLKFYDKLPKFFPHNPAMRDVFANNPQLVEVTAKRNSSLQGAYLMLAARALGLDCGPMSGFDNAKVDEEFSLPVGAKTVSRSSFPKVTSNRTSSATWVTGTAQGIPPKSTSGVHRGMHAPVS